MLLRQELARDKETLPSHLRPDILRKASREAQGAGRRESKREGDEGRKGSGEATTNQGYQGQTRSQGGARTIRQDGREDAQEARGKAKEEGEEE